MTQRNEPLTPFEEYMLIENCTERPMTFSLVATLHAAPDRVLLARAFDQVVRRHRLLCARLADAGRPAWCGTRGGPPRLTVSRRETSDAAGESYIDVSRQAGLRATLGSFGDESRLTLRFHHSCCDGLAAVGFLKELLSTYAQHMAGRANGQQTLEAQEWPSRNSERTGPMFARWLSYLGKDLARILAFCCRRPLSLAATAPADPANRPEPVEPVVRGDIWLAPRETLKQRHGVGTTINDVILRDVFSAVAEWTQRGERANRKDWIRLAVATNMRERGASPAQCKNDVSMVFLDRRRCGIEDSHRLLQGISTEMSQIKRDRMGRALLRALKWLQAIPRGLSVVRLVNAPATVAVSNLGEIGFDPGSSGPTEGHVEGRSLVKRMSVVVPIRRGVPIAIGVLTYEGRLTVCMQYDRSACDRSGARDLFSLLLARIEGSLGEQLEIPHPADLGPASSSRSGYAAPYEHEDERSSVVGASRSSPSLQPAGVTTRSSDH